MSESRDQKREEAAASERAVAKELHLMRGNLLDPEPPRAVRADEGTVADHLAAIRGERITFNPTDDPEEPDAA